MVYETQQAQIDRRNALAQALMSQGQFSGADVNRVASGGLEVPISPFATAAKLFSGGAGAYEMGKANDATDALQKQKDADAKSNVSALVDQLAGPSQMQAAPGAAPIGTSTSFAGASPDAQVQTDPNAPQVETNQKRAALAALLKNQDPAAVQQMLMGPALAKFGPPKVQSVGDGGDLVSTDPMTGATTKVFENPKDLKPSAEDRALIDVVDPKAPGGYRTIKRDEFTTGMQTYHKPDSGQALANGLGGSALDDAATKYRLTGELPPNRSGALSVKIMNRAAEMSDLAGDSAGARVIRQKAGVAAAGALKKFEGNAQAISGFEKLASKSADLMDGLASQVDRTGVPFYNRWKQAGQKEFTDNADLRAFEGQMQTFTGEYGKIMSGSMGNTALSDTASAHARELIKTADGPKSYAKIMATLRQDMANRISSQSDERTDLYNTIGGNNPDTLIPGAGAKAAPVAPPAAAAPGGHPSEINALLNKYK